MRHDKMTVKVQEVLEEAAVLAREYNHNAVDISHLLYSLIEQEEGVVTPLLARLGVNRDRLMSETEGLVKGLPRVYGDNVQVSLSPAAIRIFDKAEKVAGNLKDEYISAEHLLLAILEDDGASGKLLAREGVTKDGILKALQSIRGNQRVTDQNPEEKYQVLDKYCKDLTALARQEKLDPVIGRDEEIRRVHAGPFPED